MFPPFPTEKASIFLKSIFSLLKEKKIEIKNIGLPSQERKNQGVMLGSAICINSNQEEIKLLCLSGISKEIKLNVENLDFEIVNPIISQEEINKALSENDEEIHKITAIIKEKKLPEAEIKILKEKRNLLCNQSLEKVYDLYSFTCFDKKEKSLKELCKENFNSKLPPTGTGECCAPKLIDFANKNNLQIISMAEFFYTEGMEFNLENISYPCDERCKIILPSMLGLEILYRDEDIIVVNKQSGLLSVPGRGPDKQDCIVNRLKNLFPQTIKQPAVHRLDMETSGLLVLAFTKEAHKNLSKQFEECRTSKKYVALLDGVLQKKGIANSGQMELYFRLDVENRPHQIWDSQYGKKAITQWKILNVEKYRDPEGTLKDVTRVEFVPITGRTHQLRLASADSHGFSVPIIGDTLYGKCIPGERLMLHAENLSFYHPTTNELLEFYCPSPF